MSFIHFNCIYEITLQLESFQASSFILPCFVKSKYSTLIGGLLVCQYSQCSTNVILSQLLLFATKIFHKSRKSFFKLSSWEKVNSSVTFSYRLITDRIRDIFSIIDILVALDFDYCCCSIITKFLHF